MGYAVELFYDHESEIAVRKVWDGAGEALGRSSLSNTGARPHISLAVYNDDLDPAGFPEKLQEFAESTEPFEFRLSSVGTFPGNEGVVYLSPVVTQDLLAIHQQYHETFLKYEANVQAYYLPGNWVPHCTVAIDLEASGIPEVVAYCRARFQQVTGRFTEIGLVEFRPVKELFTVELGQVRRQP